MNVFLAHIKQLRNIFWMEWYPFFKNIFETLKLASTRRDVNAIAAYIYLIDNNNQPIFANTNINQHLFGLTSLFWSLAFPSIDQTIIIIKIYWSQSNRSTKSLHVNTMGYSTQLWFVSAMCIAFSNRAAYT